MDAGDPGTVALIGGGGHALVVADAASQTGLALRGFYDDDADAPAIRLGLAHLGRLRAAPTGPFLLAVGGVTLRRSLLNALAAQAPSVVHPRAFVARTADLGAGVFVGPGAVVHTLARVEAHAIINTGAIVEHECRIGENVHVAPGAVLGGRAVVGADTLLGIGCRVLPGVRIGPRCVVGAGAVILHDLPEGARVAGVPARPV